MVLIFMSGTPIQTRPSLLYQGILVGFYVNDLARWGQNSVLQTVKVLRGDGTLNLDVPSVISPATDLQHKKSIIFKLTFDSLYDGAQADGISVHVTDVERYHGYRDDLVLGISRSANTSTPETI